MAGVRCCISKPRKTRSQGRDVSHCWSPRNPGTISRMELARSPFSDVVNNEVYLHLNCYNSYGRALPSDQSKVLYTISYLHTFHAYAIYDSSTQAPSDALTIESLTSVQNHNTTTIYAAIRHEEPFEACWTQHGGGYLCCGIARVASTLPPLSIALAASRTPGSAGPSSQ